MSTNTNNISTKSAPVSPAEQQKARLEELIVLVTEINLITQRLVEVVEEVKIGSQMTEKTLNMLRTSLRKIHEAEI